MNISGEDNNHHHRFDLQGRRRTSAPNCGKRSQVRYAIEVFVEGILEYLLTAACSKKQRQAGAQFECIEVLVEGILEYLLTAACSKKQRQAGAQLECVNITENLISRSSFNAQKKIYAFDQARSEHGVIKVGLRFACRRNGVLLRRRMNHIQWLVFSPCINSSSTCG
jgi:hypothetical protein